VKRNGKSLLGSKSNEKKEVKGEGIYSVMCHVCNDNLYATLEKKEVKCKGNARAEANRDDNGISMACMIFQFYWVKVVGKSSVHIYMYKLQNTHH
jgi:hypothetical protein